MRREEIRDIIIATAVLAFAFANVFFTGFSIAGFVIALLVVAVVFVAHELGHRTLARRYGCFAEFRVWPFGLLLAVVTSFFGFIFAAPGAVYISPIVRERFAFRITRLTPREYGHIALSGPVVNIALGMAFAALFWLLPYTLLLLIARFSFFLAMFNLFPFAPLDGQKVLSWSWRAWAAALAMAIIGYILLLYL
jgi:Zn-dependent protease